MQREIFNFEWEIENATKTKSGSTDDDRYHLLLER